MWAPRGGTPSPIQRDSCDLQAAEEMASEGRVRRTSLEAKFVPVDVFDENNRGWGRAGVTAQQLGALVLAKDSD